MKINLKDNKAITLVTLVITIVVILILSGAIIVISLNDNGVIFRAKDAVNRQDAATDEEEKGLENLDTEIYDQLVKAGVREEKKIKFSIGGNAYAQANFGEFEAKEGMTWKEWLESEYNTKKTLIKFYSNSWGDEYIYIPPGANLAYEKGDYNSVRSVEPYDKIIDGYEYIVNY